MASPSASCRRLRVVPPWRDRRISASIPLAAELKNKLALHVCINSSKALTWEFSAYIKMFYMTTMIDNLTIDY